MRASCEYEVEVDPTFVVPVSHDMQFQLHWKERDLDKPFLRAATKAKISLSSGAEPKKQLQPTKKNYRY